MEAVSGYDVVWQGPVPPAQTTHYEGCWRDHLACAVARVESAEGLIIDLGPESDWQSKVAEFMTKNNVDKAAVATRWLAKRLIEEESLELLAAFDVLDDKLVRGTADMAPLAKELADVLYVVLYAANVFSIPMDAVFSAVHRSNMTKDGGRREDGKKQKGPSYVDPMQEIREILEERNAKD